MQVLFVKELGRCFELQSLAFFDETLSAGSSVHEQNAECAGVQLVSIVHFMCPLDLLTYELEEVWLCSVFMLRNKIKSQYS